MDRMRPSKPTQGPEAKVQQELINFLKIRDWLVMPTHGNVYQFGFPDLFCAHLIHGSRWVEVKYLHKHEFTPAQVKFFPLMYAHGVGVWILTAATESEYQKLFQPCNYHGYMMMKL